MKPFILIVEDDAGIKDVTEDTGVFLLLL